jgi:hypothetical protein
MPFFHSKERHAIEQFVTHETEAIHMDRAGAEFAIEIPVSIWDFISRGNPAVLPKEGP